MESGEVWALFRDTPYASGWPYGWHPDSRQVLFWFFDEDLRLVNVETGEYARLALTDGPVQGAAISPDGQSAVYIAGSVSSYRSMWKVSTSGGNARVLFDLGGPSRVYAWSPDGSNIVYASGSGVGFKEAASGTPIPGGPLWLMDPEGQNRRPLSGPSIFGSGFEPAWSPDGQWLALTGLEGKSFGCAQKDPPPDPETCRYDGMAVYIENIFTGELRRLASGIEPIWSPDGSMLAFLSRQSGATEVWATRADGTGLQQLTNDAQRKWRVTWSASTR